MPAVDVDMGSRDQQGQLAKFRLMEEEQRQEQSDCGT